MRLPDDVIIAPEKLAKYLLTFRPWDDKSGFLRIAGFTSDHPHILEQAIRELVGATEAVEDGENEYGGYYRVEGELKGPQGQRLAVVLIWLRRNIDGRIHLVTLKPRKR